MEKHGDDRHKRIEVEEEVPAKLSIDKDPVRRPQLHRRADSAQCGKLCGRAGCPGSAHDINFVYVHKSVKILN